MQCPTCDSTIHADDLHCSATGQEYCDQCHVDAEMWLFGTTIMSKQPEYCENCTVVPVKDGDKYCERCVKDILNWLAASYVAQDALYLQQVTVKEENMQYGS